MKQSIGIPHGIQFVFRSKVLTDKSGSKVLRMPLKTKKQNICQLVYEKNCQSNLNFCSFVIFFVAFVRYYLVRKNYI